MVRDHEAMNKRALDLVKKLKVRPEDNDTSKALTKAASNVELKSLLQTGLKIFRGHEQHAEHLASMLK